MVTEIFRLFLEKSNVKFTRLRIQSQWPARTTKTTMYRAFVDGVDEEEDFCVNG